MSDDVAKQIAQLQKQIETLSGSTNSYTVDTNKPVAFDADRASDPEYLGTFMQDTLDAMSANLMNTMTNKLDTVVAGLSKQQQQFMLKQQYGDVFTEDETFDKEPVVPGLSLTWGELRKKAIEEGNEADIKAYLERRGSVADQADKDKKQKQVDASDPASTKGRTDEVPDDQKPKDAEQVAKQRDALMRKAMNGDDDAAKKLREMGQ
jgi:hypothetical protein